MNQHRITPMTESGLLAALTVMLALAAVYLPVLGMAAALIWPLPVLVLVVRHGVRWGLMAVLVSGVIMALLIEPMIALRLVLAFAPTGLMLGLGFRRRWAGARTFVMALAASLGGKLLVFALLFAVTAVNPLGMEMDTVRESFDAAFRMYEEMGIDAGQLQQSRAEIDAGLSMLALLMPLVVLMMGLLDTLVAYLLGTRILRRLGHDVPQLPPFEAWRLPSAFLYLFGFALVGLYWGGTRDIPQLYQAAMNANMLALFAGLIQGLSLSHCVMRHFHLPTSARVLIYAMILLSGILTQIVALTGLIDMIFDYRRRFGERNKK